MTSDGRTGWDTLFVTRMTKNNLCYTESGQRVVLRLYIISNRRKDSQSNTKSTDRRQSQMTESGVQRELMTF